LRIAAAAPDEGKDMTIEEDLCLRIVKPRLEERARTPFVSEVFEEVIGHARH
jgi:hypothetical protein